MNEKGLKGFCTIVKTLKQTISIIRSQEHAVAWM